MPQPLQILDPPPVFRQSAINERPDLAISIVRISTAWAGIEVLLGLLLARALGASSHSGVSMYVALSGSAAQNAALSAAIATVASPSAQEEFAHLLETVRKRGKERNRVIHCLWGTSPAYPGALIATAPDTVVMESTVGLALSVILASADPANTKVGADLFQSCLVYRQPDFADIEARLIETREAIKAFTQKLVQERQKRLGLIQTLGTLLESGGASAPPQKLQTTPPKSE